MAPVLAAIDFEHESLFLARKPSRVTDHISHLVNEFLGLKRLFKKAAAGRNIDGCQVQLARYAPRALGEVTALAVCDRLAYIAHIKSEELVMPTKVTRGQVAKRPNARRLTAVLEDARRAGLLDGDKTQHVSFRAPPALIEAARRESGVSSSSELGILALATLAQPDPVATFLKRTKGVLGEAHALDY
jgi:hypothetical protein